MILSVVLPAYNEEENIGIVLDDVFAYLNKNRILGEVIVINDGSRDRTLELLNNYSEKINNLVIVSHPKNLGYGAALRSGFAKATGDLIFFMDSDRQFDINELGLFLYKIKDYDFLVGYRKNRQDQRHRILMAGIFRYITRVLFGIWVRDVDCAFKLFKKDVVKGVPLISDGALINLEIFARAERKGYKFIELPITHFPRQGGASKGATIRVIFKALINVLSLRSKFRKGCETNPS